MTLLDPKARSEGSKLLATPTAQSATVIQSSWRDFFSRKIGRVPA